MVNGQQPALEEPVCGPDEAGQRCIAETLPPASQSGVVTAMPCSGRGDTEVDESSEHGGREQQALLADKSVASWAAPAAGPTLADASVGRSEAQLAASRTVYEEDGVASMPVARHSLLVGHAVNMVGQDGVASESVVARPRARLR